jgi:hypothetical protein
VACNINATSAYSTVRYERGAGEATISNITFVFADANGVTMLNYTTVTPNALESRLFVTNTTSRPVSVSIAATVKTETGDSKLCEKTSSVQCT